jgi:CcmD family protein
VTTNRPAIWFRCLAPALALTILAWPASVLGRQDPQDGFVPMTPGQMHETLPATPLVFAAYAVAWLVVLAYVFFVWRRLGRVQQELAALNARLKSGARE